MGAQLPEYSIPSLMEKIIKEKYGKESVIINFGIGGTMSTESLSILLHEALEYLPDLVIFYDGWNCCSYLTAMESIRNNNSSKYSLKPFPGVGFRQFEHDFMISNEYDWLGLSKKSLFLLINNFLTKLAVITESITGTNGKSHIRRIGNRLFSKYLHIKSHNSIQKMIREANNVSQSKIDQTAEIAVNRYVSIHEICYSVCKAKDIEFIHLLQPLLMWGKQKILSKNEEDWKNSGFSSGDPRIFKSFYHFLSESAYSKNKYFYDLSSIFSNIEDELYIDTGHLNKKGNFFVSERISDMLKNKGLI